MIESAICLDRIRILTGKTKKEVLEELIECFSRKGDVADTALLEEAIFYREKLMSTGIGLGIAVPHVRLEGIHEPVAAVGVSHSGIADYQSIDGQTIHIIVMIVAGKEQHQKYIQLLAQFITRLKAPGIIGRLKQADSPSDIQSILTEK